DLVGERGDGQLPVDLGQFADAAAPPAGRERLPAPVHGRVRGTREHRAARTVQVPGEDVQHVHEPAVQRPVCLGAGADPPVDGGASGGRELAGRAADGLRGDAGDVRDPLGGEVDGEGAQVVQAVDASLQVLG